jgi:hypothetical protein
VQEPRHPGHEAFVSTGNPADPASWSEGAG